jgi:uncharacterized surface protein with fasciclin (FAS1) repeats
MFTRTNHTLPAGIIALVVTLLFATGLHAQDLEMDDEPTAAGNDVVSVVAESPNHTIFAQLIEEAQLTETLQQPGPFTILAPSDDAFEPLEDELNELRQNPQELQNVMINHLFQGEANADDVEENFGIEVDDGDIDADNGIVHSIPEVILER